MGCDFNLIFFVKFVNGTNLVVTVNAHYHKNNCFSLLTDDWTEHDSNYQYYTMNETSTSNIKQILAAFDNIHIICLSPNWTKTVTPEDIKTAFKLGFFIEKTMAKFSEQQTVPSFMNTLKLWGETNNKVFSCDYIYYSNICDHLLLKFFNAKALNENIMDIAIRMYTSLFPTQRLQSFIKNLLLKSASLEAIFDFAVANKSLINVEKLQHELLLNEWIKEVENGRKEYVSALITDSLSSYKIEAFLPVLISILTIKSDSVPSELIIENILLKMLDRSILSKQFWLVLVKNVDKTCIGRVCVNYKEFLVSLCNFLFYIGGMMEEKVIDGEICWSSDLNISLCPEISYNEIESIIQYLCNVDSEIKMYILSRLNEGAQHTDLFLWKHIMQKCQKLN